MCSGTYLCGLVSTLPEGIALLVGNDLCSDELIADVNIVTRSMTAAQAAKNEPLTPQNAAPKPSELGNATAADKTSEEYAPESEILSDVAPLFAEHPVTIDTVNRAQLIELQQHDSSLQSLFALCDQENSD